MTRIPHIRSRRRVAAVFLVLLAGAFLDPSLRHAARAHAAGFIHGGAGFWHYARYMILAKNGMMPRTTPVDQRWIAHAGGAVAGNSYTNSLDALESSYALGARVFELDFSWTADDRLVVGYNWEVMSHAFGLEPHVLTLGEFVAARRLDGLRQITFEDLLDWMRAHPDTLVVTDTKFDNFKLMKAVRTGAGDTLGRFILQIYRIDELPVAKRIGARAVWLTIYKSAYPPWMLALFADAMPIDAVVVPVDRLDAPYERLLSGRRPLYAHSIPRAASAAYAREHPAVFGFYVD